MGDAAFIGAGSIAEALLKGLSRRGWALTGVGITNQANTDRLRAAVQTFGVCAGTKSEILPHRSLWILAVKPKDAAKALGESREFLSSTTVVVSLVAGLSTGRVQDLLGRTVPVVRAMPNTPSQVGAGVTALAFSQTFPLRKKFGVIRLFRAVGEVLEVQEAHLDAVTALSGSGPAYIYHILDALVEAGCREGLTPESARILAISTLNGAAKMAKETGKTPADLIQQVASPGGTTAAALDVLRKKGVQEAFSSAVTAAAKRSRELSER